MNNQEKSNKSKGYLIELINGRKILFMKDKSLKEIYIEMNMSPNGFIIGDAIDDYFLTKSYRRSNIATEMINFKSIATVKPIQYSLED